MEHIGLSITLFGYRNRRRILNPGVKGYLSRLFPKVIKHMPGCEIIEQNMQDDHIHMLMVILPKYAVSDVIGEIKQCTASKLRKKFVWLDKVYRKENVVWSPGYFVSTVGLDEKQITEYVKWQGHQDSGQASLDLKSATGYARGYLRHNSLFCYSTRVHFV